MITDQTSYLVYQHHLSVRAKLQTDYRNLSAEIRTISRDMKHAQKNGLVIRSAALQSIKASHRVTAREMLERIIQSKLEVHSLHIRAKTSSDKPSNAEKESYLAFRKDWKTRYEALSAEIRLTRDSMKHAQKKGPLTRGDALQSIKARYRADARAMLESLAQAKIDAGNSYTA